jgi:pimeloyl-ACP methyl ester carboxylesterase
MKELCKIAASLGIGFDDDTAPAEGFGEINGVRLHWLDWGHATRPALVFLHGAGLSAHTWDLVCLNMRDDYHCVALDQRGHGLSDGAFSFGVEEPRADIRGVVEALSLEKPVFVGMSVGGNNLIAYAGAHASDMAGAVFVDICPTVPPGAYTQGIANDAAMAQARSFEDAVEIAHCIDPRGSKAFKRHTLSYSLEKVPDGSWCLRYERNKIERSAAYMAERRERLWSYVPRVTCPSLVVHGADSFAQTFENLEQFRAKLPDAAIIQISGAGHDVQEDQPKALAEAIRGFLTRIGY